MSTALGVRSACTLRRALSLMVCVFTIGGAAGGPVVLRPGNVVFRVRTFNSSAGLVGDSLAQFDPNTGDVSPVAATAGLLQNVNGLAFAPDGTLFIADADTGLLARDPNTGALRNVPLSAPTQALALAFESHDRLLIGGKGGIARLDTSTGKSATLSPVVIDGLPRETTTMAVARDGTIYASIQDASEPFAELFTVDPGTGSLTHVQGLTDNLALFLVEPNGKLLANVDDQEQAGPPATLEMDAVTGTFRFLLRPDQPDGYVPLAGLAQEPDGQYIGTSIDQKIVRLHADTGPSMCCLAVKAAKA